MNELREAFVMKAFGLDVKKDDIRAAMKAIGKEVNDTIVFDEFIKIMAPRIVNFEIVG